MDGPAFFNFLMFDNTSKRRVTCACQCVLATWEGHHYAIMSWVLDHDPIPGLLKIMAQGCAAEVESDLGSVPNLCCAAMAGNRMRKFEVGCFVLESRIISVALAVLELVL